jgi:hypothetical protein
MSYGKASGTASTAISYWKASHQDSIAIWAGAETSQNGEIRIWNALSVIGTKVMAKEYCDENGNNCSEASWGGGSIWTKFYHKVAYGSSKVTVTCNSWHIRIACSGSREQNVDDTCGEDDCWYIGTIPTGTKSCTTGIDSGGWTEATVYAYCFNPN